MKTKTYILIIFLFLFQFIHCQKGKVVYKRTLNFSTEKIQNFELLFNQGKSIFIEADTILSNELSSKIIDEYNSKIKINFKSENKSFVYSNSLENTMLSQIDLLKSGENTTLIIKEEFTNKFWKISNEIKKIGDIECQKATGNFRGRKYTAWFAINIPVAFGPWKFNSLPGLIINIIDDTNEVSFSAISIKIPFQDEFEINSMKFDEENKNNLPLEDYIKLLQKQDKEFKKMLLSKMPKGAKLQFNDIRIKAIELAL